MAAYSGGDEIELRIADLNHDGEGVGRALDGRVFFVPGALPGDVVRARVAEIKKRHGAAELVDVLEPSAGRVAAPCPVAASCGGCAVQHFAYEHQLAWKEQRVRDALRRIGGLEARVLPILGMEHPFRYRNKAQYPLQISPSGEVIAGFYKKGSHELVPSDDCLIQHPLIPKAVRAARRLVQELGIPVYDESAHAGIARHVVVRASFSTGELLVTLVTASSDFPWREAWVKGLLAAVPGLAGVAQNVNLAQTNAIMGEKTRILWGRPYIVERLEELSFEISPASFFQVNTAQALELYRAVRRLAALTGAESVWDVYCGTGSIGLFLSPRIASLRGVDVAPSAIRDAKRNAALNGVSDRAHFEVGKAEDVLPKWVAEGGRADVCLLDPPRKGCDPVTLESVCQARPERIIYVSCNPATLARDLAFLTARGYRLGEVQPVDMFPHTPHVEAVARLVA